MEIKDTFFTIAMIIVVFFVVMRKSNSLIIRIDDGLLDMGKILEGNPTNSIVREYIIGLNNSKAKKTGEEWRQIKKAFFAVYRSNLVSPQLKKGLYDAVINSGCIINNFTFKETDENEYKIRKSGAEGENRVAYALKWLPKTYLVFNNIKIKSSIEKQEFDNIVVGPNGIFHIETKNFGGEFGATIRISKSGEWITYKKGEEICIESPEFQLKRHDIVLQENLDKYFGKDKYKTSGIIVLSNPKTLLKEAKNCDVPVIKSGDLVKYISDYQCEKELNDREIREIYELISYSRA